MINNGDPRLLGFFGNSGIKIFNVPLEIQIFDTDALLDMLNIDTTGDLDRVISSLSSYLHKDHKQIKVPGYDHKYDQYGVLQEIYEKCGCLVSGELYEYPDQIPYVSVYGLINARNRQQDSNTMVIDLSKRDVAGESYYYLNVVINDFRTITNKDVSEKVKSSNNKTIRIQSHWGSGVRFNNIEVRGY